MTGQRMERFREKYGGGVTSVPLGVRLAVTAPFALLGLLLVRSLVLAARADDPRPAALVLFCLGLLAYGAKVLLPPMWEASSEWRSDTYRAQQLERRLRRTDTNAWSWEVACAVCGQDGTPVATRAGAYCPECRRPLPAP